MDVNLTLIFVLTLLLYVLLVILHAIKLAFFKRDPTNRPGFLRKRSRSAATVIVMGSGKSCFMEENQTV